MVSLTLLPKTLVFMLAICVVFTVALTDNLQLADGFTSMSVKLEYKIQPGETQMLTWGIMNDNNKEPLVLEMFATGPGAELFVFEENISIEPSTVKQIEIFVIVPEDYPTDLELHPQVIAKKIDPVKAGTTGATINMILQHVTNPKILIGDNPIYYPAEVIAEVIPDIATNDDTPKAPTPKVESIPGETMQEKLDRIKATNLANQLDSPDDVWEEEAVPELQVDDNYMEEPTAAPVAQEEKVECGFIDWLLSLFGMAKC